MFFVGCVAFIKTSLKIHFFNMTALELLLSPLLFLWVSLNLINSFI